MQNTNSLGWSHVIIEVTFLCLNWFLLRWSGGYIDYVIPCTHIWLRPIFVILAIIRIFRTSHWCDDNTESSVKATIFKIALLADMGATFFFGIGAAFILAGGICQLFRTIF